MADIKIPEWVQRVAIVLTAPVWIPSLIVAFILLVTVPLFVLYTIAGPFSYVITGSWDTWGRHYRYEVLGEPR